jgi:tetrahydromethanopterin S-methyltransferase subunit C
MSVAAGGGESKIDKKKLEIYGIAGGLIGIYLAAILNGALGTNWFSFLAGIGVIAAVVMGSDAVRRVCAYGIGTGVPSIGMLALGMGMVCAMFALAVGGIAGPIIGVVLGMAFGFFVGSIANKVIKLNIPVLEECLTDLAGAGALVLIGLSVMVSGTIDYGAVIDLVVNSGYIAVIFIAGALAILHPFNATLGPDETQDRTLTLAVATGALAMIAAGIASIATLGMPGVLTLVVGFIIWIKFFLKFFELTKRDASGVVPTGLLPPGGM